MSRIDIARHYARHDFSYALAMRYLKLVGVPHGDAHNLLMAMGGVA